MQTRRQVQPAAGFRFSPFQADLFVFVRFFGFLMFRMIVVMMAGGTVAGAADVRRRVDALTAVVIGDG